MAFLLPLLIVIVTSLLGLTGGFLLIYYQKWAKFISKYLINFSIGALFGVVFLDIIPEISTQNQNQNVFIFVLVGILVFYILEKSLIYYHHHSVEHVWHENHHTKEEKLHSVPYLLAIGDALHNFIDGIIISASFLISIHLGIVTSITILLHELPQEIGQFAIMLHANFGRYKTALYSTIAQMAAVFGFLLGYFFLPYFSYLKFIVLGFAAGGFIYIACTDLLPETHREKSLEKSVIQVTLLLLGIFVIGFVGHLLK